MPPLDEQTLDKPEDQHHCDTDIAVAVITPSGIYPDEQDFHRAKPQEPVKAVLELAAEKLHLKNTNDWIALVCGREINPAHSFEQLGLSGVVEIEWHKREGGGGRA